MSSAFSSVYVLCLPILQTLNTGEFTLFLGVQVHVVIMILPERKLHMPVASLPVNKKYRIASLLCIFETTVGSQ